MNPYLPCDKQNIDDLKEVENEELDDEDDDDCLCNNCSSRFSCYYDSPDDCAI